jgi:hypothetical protein
MLKRYDSIADLTQAAINFNIRNNYAFKSNSDMGSSWFNNETIEQCLTYAAFGNDNLVPEAERYIEQLNTDMEVKRPEWIPSPAGAFPSVPDYCRGLPCSMRRQSFEPNDNAKINIIVTTTCSGGIDAKTQAKRGAAILALIIKLAAARPIALYHLATTHGVDNGETLLLTELNTAPLDLASACYVLTSAGFDRYITHHVAYHLNGFNGSWPKNYEGKEEQFYRELIPRLGFNPADTIFVKPTYLTDPIVSKPLLWVTEQIERFNNLIEEEQ